MLQKQNNFFCHYYTQYY